MVDTALSIAYLSLYEVVVYPSAEVAVSFTCDTQREMKSWYCRVWKHMDYHICNSSSTELLSFFRLLK